MDLIGVKYDAFISYRHSKKDMFIAQSIHKRLENFKLPKSALDKVANGKAKIERIFRDQDELPLADNLSDPISVALENSEFLIVICTPRLPESQWCRKEITTFIKMHDRDHVLLVLAEGEPEDSFPYELTHEETEVTLPDGTVSKTIREIEPLAADVRGDSTHEISKKLDDATLRLAAAMFGLNYDDLKQRHKEQQTKRKLRIFGSIAAAMFIFGLVCFFMMLTIKSQKNTISEQLETISTQYDTISDQYNTISDQYNTIETQYADIEAKYQSAMINASDRLLKCGRRKDAVYAIANAINSDEYSSKVEFALSKALNVYNSDNLRFPTDNYDIESNAAYMDISKKSTYLAIQGSNNDIYVFNTKTGEKTAIAPPKSDIEPNINSTRQCIYFSNDSVLYYNMNDTLYRYDTVSGKSSSVLDSVLIMYGSPSTELVFAERDTLLYAFDAEGNEVFKVNILDGSTTSDRYSFIVIDGFAVSSSGQTLSLVSTNLNSGHYLSVFDLTSGSLILKIPVEIDASVAFCCDDEYVYTLTAQYDFTTAASSPVVAEAFKIKSGESLWKRVLDSTFFTSIKTADGILIANSNNNFVIMDAANGDVTFDAAVENSILETTYNSGYIYVIDSHCNIYAVMKREPGAELTLTNNALMDITRNFFSIQPENATKRLLIKDKCFYFLFNASTYVSKYSPDGHGEAEGTVLSSDEKYDYFYGSMHAQKEEDSTHLLQIRLISEDGKYIFNQKYDCTVEITDASGNLISSIYDIKESIKDVLYSDSMGKYVIQGYTYSYILGNDMQLSIQTDKFYDYADGYIKTVPYSEVMSLPYYSQAQLRSMAKEYLKDYEPSAEIKNYYGIE